MPSAVCDARPPTFLGPSAGTDTRATRWVGLAWPASGRRPIRNGMSVRQIAISQSSASSRLWAASTSSVVGAVAGTKPSTTTRVRQLASG